MHYLLSKKCRMTPTWLWAEWAIACSLNTPSEAVSYKCATLVGYPCLPNVVRMQPIGTPYSKPYLQDLLFKNFSFL